MLIIKPLSMLWFSLSSGQHMEAKSRSHNSDILIQNYEIGVSISLFFGECNVLSVLLVSLLARHEAKLLTVAAVTCARCDVERHYRPTLSHGKNLCAGW